MNRSITVMEHDGAIGNAATCIGNGSCGHVVHEMCWITCQGSEPHCISSLVSKDSNGATALWNASLPHFCPPNVYLLKKNTRSLRQDAERLEDKTAHNEEAGARIVLSPGRLLLQNQIAVCIGQQYYTLKNTQIVYTTTTQTKRKSKPKRYEKHGHCILIFAHLGTKCSAGLSTCHHVEPMLKQSTLGHSARLIKAGAHRPKSAAPSLC